MVPAALGTQTAGSGLRPAAYCGIVGLKPSYGRVSRRGIVPFSWSMDTAAIHARSVDDAAAVLTAIAGCDPADAATLPDWSLDVAAARPDGPPRLGLLHELVDTAEPELRDRLYETASLLGAAGARVQEARLPFPNELLLAVHHIIQQVEAVVAHQRLFAEQADSYPTKLRSYLEVGQFLPGAAYIHAQRVRRRIFQAVRELLGDFDALLLPTAPGPAPERGSTGSYVLLAGWTMLGLPAATLPIGLSAGGLPLALQLVGSYAADTRLVATARWCETVLGWLPAPVGGVRPSSASS
jgi:Asp-tRNA(Asn)/Glu-tRNA(Gln) amidotransferase A subunit family amidase